MRSTAGKRSERERNTRRNARRQAGEKGMRGPAAVSGGIAESAAEGYKGWKVLKRDCGQANQVMRPSQTKLVIAAKASGEMA